MKSSVLIIAFNRPDFLLKIINIVKRVKPNKIYISVDGPRKNNVYDKKNILKNYGLIKKLNLDINTKLIMNFNKKNLGSRDHPISAINWFFKKENKGIILEDDCLPNMSFFYFCDILLDRFQYNKKISMISGRNNLEHSTYKKSYYFSFGNTWGWATWKRAWKYNDPSLKNWNNKKLQNNFNKNLKDYKLLHNLLKTRCKDIINNKLNTAWDFQWFFSIISRNMIAIIPSINLVRNIGFDNRSTHTKTNTILGTIKTHEISFPLIDNDKVKINKKLLLKELHKIYKTTTLYEIKKYIYKIFKKIF
jgi:hypothetical protein